MPVNGDRSTFQSIEPGMISITAAGPHNDLFASLSTGSLAPSAGLGELWGTHGTPLAPGRHLPGLAVSARGDDPPEPPIAAPRRGR